MSVVSFILVPNNNENKKVYCDSVVLRRTKKNYGRVMSARDIKINVNITWNVKRHCA